MGRRTLLLIAALLVAALGTSLIWLYVRGADQRAQQGLATTPVYVAGQQFEASAKGETVISASQPSELPVKIVPPDAVTPGNASQLSGKVLLQRVPKGIPLTLGMFGTPGEAAAAAGLSPDKLAIEVALADPNRVAGLLQPGSYITIFATHTGSEKTSTEATQVLLDSVRVLYGGGAQSTTNAATAAIPATLVTLEVSQEEAQKIIFSQTASKKVTLWFGLKGSKDKVQIDPNSTTDSTNLFSRTTP